DQRTLDPKGTGLVEEVPHLRSHVAEAGRRAEDDGVIGREVLWRGDRSRLVDLHARAAHDFLGHELGNALERDLHAIDGARSMRHRVSESLNVAIGAVIENEDFRWVSHM